MRCAPAFQVSPRRSRGWAFAVGGLLVWALAVDVAWALQVRGAAQWWALGAVFLTLVCGGACLPFIHRMPAHLRWDGQCWLWGPPGTLGDEPHSGRVRLCLDAGFFMLLFLQPSTPSSRGVWLPLTRRTDHWHMVRCVLHGPTPADHFR